MTPSPPLGHENQDAEMSESSPLRPLSASQERKLIDYIDEQFLEITRGYKKRNHPPTTLPTLTSYLGTMHPLLTVIMLIQPIYPQASLRTMLLLRLTNESLTSIIGYEPTSQELPTLLRFLDELDRGWLTVLHAQAWDAEMLTGVDIVVPVDSAFTTKPSPVSQTDRTRLRSILSIGTERLEEWLEDIPVNGAVDLPSALDTLGIKKYFDDIFSRTLTELGEIN
ncbi:hypothetical protein BD410DRAFT_753222 [Rickenella mellea]|uniref:Uncharacterized protein n=1 Tax=Rickenella mellea TaxID=50990 RepID=A0A4Y7PVG3_9AGAM|nr:hypothetical protein BD410DRAFT_753222 [Rickenella mellea]